MSSFPLRHAIALSLCFHFLGLLSASSPFFSFSFLKPNPLPEKIETLPIEFDFFQPPETEEHVLLTPKPLPDLEDFPEPPPLDNLPPFLNEDAMSLSTKDAIPTEKQLSESQPVEETIPPEEDSEPLVSEEKKAIPETEEKTSDSLQSLIDLQALEKQEESQSIKWDYCNRIRNLIENHTHFPESLKEQGIQDSVRVLLSINQQGKLLAEYPKIPRLSQSRYPEINEAAKQAIQNAAQFFPKIPKRYLKESITFSVVLSFESRNGD